MEVAVVRTPAFDFSPMIRRNDYGTSVAAADAVRPHLSAIKTQILGALAVIDLTDEDDRILDAALDRLLVQGRNNLLTPGAPGESRSHRGW